MDILKNIKFSLTVVIVLFFCMSSGAFALDTADMFFADNSAEQSQASSGADTSQNKNQNSSPCQQMCYEQYKAGTDICYSISIASDDLNLCIMDQREIFKNCSKTC